MALGPKKIRSGWKGGMQIRGSAIQALKNLQSEAIDLLEPKTQEHKKHNLHSYVVDASAWIEYLEDTPRGRQIAAIIENENIFCFTPTSVVAEVISKTVRSKKDSVLASSIIARLSNFVDLTRDIAVVAGHIHVSAKQANKDFGMLDAFVVAAAKKLKAKILTVDSDFKPFREAIMVDST